MELYGEVEGFLRHGHVQRAQLAGCWARGGAVRFRLFGPSQEEIDEVARDLIARHGLNAYNEAIYLAEIAQLLPRSLRQRRIYELAAVQIERSFETALKQLRERSAGNFAQH